MMRNTELLGERMSRKVAEAFHRELQPNVYAVLHLNRQADGELACREIYRNEVVRFLARLSKRVLGSRRYRSLPQGRRLLANAVTIEMEHERPHLNVMIRSPSSWSFESFREAFEEEWSKSPWAADHAGAFYCEPAFGGAGVLNYCHKEGDLALIHEALTF